MILDLSSTQQTKNILPTDCIPHVFPSVTCNLTHENGSNNNESVRDKIDKIFNENILSTSTIIEDNNNKIGIPTPCLSSNTVKVNVTEDLTENKTEKVAKILNDTILPTKRLLHASDPFAFLLSFDYLLYFTFGAAVTLFVLNLLNY